MNCTPLISVIMPVYNGAQYLRPAIDSILKQSFQNFEFLIIDDCSTDDTVNIITSYNDKRIHLTSSSVRLKLAGALNLGIQNAKGEFIARMDADDISAPERLQFQIDFFRRNEDVGICGSWIQLFPEIKAPVQTYPTHPDAVHALSLFHSPFAHPSVMIRRSWFQQHDLLYDVNFYPTEDFDLWCRALTHFKGANINKVLLQYRVHKQSLTGSDWSNMDEQAARITQRALHTLKLPEDIETGRYHRKVAMVQIDQTAEELNRAASWLTTLIEANLKENIYSHTALAETIEDLWYRICMHCATTGTWSFKFFLQQRFHFSRLTTCKHIFILSASCIKHALKRRIA